MFPIAATTKWVCLQSDIGIGGDMRVHIIDPAHRRSHRLISFPSGDVDPKAWAWALSDSGRHLLLVSPTGPDLWDLETETHAEQPDLRELLPLRKCLAETRGTPGTWWISDDLSQVVVVPSEFIKQRGGESHTGEAMLFKVAGVQIDTQHQGILFDRTSQMATPFETRLSEHRRPTNLLAVMWKDGSPRFLFGAISHFVSNKELVLVQANHNVIASLNFETGPADMKFSSCDPRTGELVFIGRTGEGTQRSGPNGDAPRDAFLFFWNPQTSKTRRIDILASSIRTAVEGD